jgi:hypothetical protein
MQSRRLEAFSRLHPTVAPLIQKLTDYLDWLQTEGQSVVIPRVASVRLHISEADTIALLGLFRDDGLVRPRYDLVCRPTNSVLASYHSLADIPDEQECQICGDLHDADELRIELVFEIVRGRAANAAA